MKFVFLLVLTFAISSLSSFAASQSKKLSDRYEMVKVDGHLVKIRDLTLELKLSVPQFADWLNQLVANYQELEKSGDFKSKAKVKFEKEFFLDLEKLSADFDNSPDKFISTSKNTLKNLDKFNLKSYLDNSQVQDLFSQFDGVLNSTMDQFDFAAVAVLNDNSYFFKRNFLRGLTLTAAGMASSAVSSTIAASVASYILTRMVEMLYEMKSYHQNILLQYLSTHNAESLGISEEDRLLAMSSIFESMIPWWNFYEFYLSQVNFSNYGNSQVEYWVEDADERLSDYKDNYVEVRERLTMSHQVAVETDSSDVLIKDLSHVKSFFSWGPNESFNYSDPSHQFDMRIFYEVFKLALSAVPVPGVSTILNPYINSRYLSTKISEGVLYGYFEEKGDQTMLGLLIDQTVNPWDYAFKL